MMKIDWEQRRMALKELQAQSIEQKIQRSQDLLERALQYNRHPGIAWSGGKDSTVLLHMALKLSPNIDVIWVNTGVEFPECVHFIQQLKDLWRLNLYIARPEITFWEATEKFGWPMLGKGGTGSWESRAAYLERSGRHKLAKATREAKISAACCRLLKHNPSEKLYRELGIDCLVVGNMVAESRQRYFTWAQRGDYFFAVGESRYKLWPLAAWNDDDVWEYHKRYNLPHSKIYDKGHRRNGCWPCLMDIRFPDNKLKALHHSHPKLWEFLIVEKGLGKRLLALKLSLNDEEITYTSLETMDSYIKMLIEKMPCYFDTL